MEYATIEGLRIAYERRVPVGGGTGVRILYVHGTSCHAQVFERHLGIVSGRHETVAIDLPGHGESEGDGYRGVADYAFFAGGLIEHLGWDRCIVAGHSLGGGIALALALYFPERVAGLVLIDTGARLRVDPAIIAAARRNAAGAPAAAQNPHTGFARATSMQVIEPIKTLMDACRPDVTAKDWIADDSCDLISRLGQIPVPALAICGKEDEFTPVKYHEFFRDRLPDCRLAVIPGAGHWPFVEQPAAFDREVLAFLDAC